MPEFKKNTSPAMKKGSSYKMKYQGTHSAFPFKSPIKNEEKEEQVTTAAGVEKGVVKSKAMIRLEANKPDEGSPGYAAWLNAYNDAKAKNLATAGS